MIDELWIGEDHPRASRPAVMLVAILSMSNDAERESDPFRRRIKLNEMQAAIQGAKGEIEAFAEGIVLAPDEEDRTGF